MLRQQPIPLQSRMSSDQGTLKSRPKHFCARQNCCIISNMWGPFERMIKDDIKQTRYVKCSQLVPVPNQLLASKDNLNPNNIWFMILSNIFLVLIHRLNVFTLVQHAKHPVTNFYLEEGKSRTREIYKILYSWDIKYFLVEIQNTLNLSLVCLWQSASAVWRHNDIRYRWDLDLEMLTLRKKIFLGG